MKLLYLLLFCAPLSAMDIAKPKPKPSVIIRIKTRIHCVRDYNIPVPLQRVPQMKIKKIKVIKKQENS